MTKQPASSDLWNEDIAPTDPAHRTWTWLHYGALWIGMVMCIPVYLMASGLIEEGMSAAQAVTTVLIGNLIVLIPLLLIGHAGAKYGIPFAVLIRSSFGIRGSRLPAILRALVGCGWFGIQCWVGGSALYAIGNIVTGGALNGPVVPALGINIGQFVSFLLFWAMHLYFIKNGPESIRWIETYTAPLKIIIVAALLLWAYNKAGGFGDILTGASAFDEGGKRAGQFWSVFWPSLTAMAGFWGTLALNIADFTRFARSQRDQVIGQAIGLPIPMAALSFVGAAVTSATIIIYGEAIWDPVNLAGRMEGFAVAIGLAIITIDTLCVNLAANTVGPAYDFSAISPRYINFARGGYITAILGVIMAPWKLIESTQGYIFTWLTGYGALLGPVLGVMLADYWLVRRRQIDVNDLFKANGQYTYINGWNPAAIIAFALGVLPNLPGFLHTAFPASFPNVSSIFLNIYTFAWFVGVFIAMGVYYLLMRRQRQRISADLQLQSV